MGNRSISRDVKIAAINLYEQGHLSLQQILACVGFSESTFYRVLRLWRTTGDVIRPRKRPGRHRILHHDDLQYLLRLVHLEKHNRFISVHFTTIHRELERAGMSYTILKEIAMERNEPCRMDFVREAAQYPAHYLGFLDETSKNDKTPGRRLLTCDGMLASTVVEGSMHREQYLEFLEHQVVRFYFVFLPHY
ncbi:hypothetical protein DFH08DRAFT_918686 [Mycena albidolilacea]|uniref:Transposase n=1 Tax=Mycena albidolilacea TaxID=1033008 RepID=A0AAD7E9I7_9AGAR|nr:hypothetical protein DFH08DRAFT_918686 [Mycena albidolilacea]